MGRRGSSVALLSPTEEGLFGAEAAKRPSGPLRQPQPRGHGGDAAAPGLYSGAVSAGAVADPLLPEVDDGLSRLMYSIEALRFCGSGANPELRVGPQGTVSSVVADSIPMRSVLRDLGRHLTTLLEVVKQGFADQMVLVYDHQSTGAPGGVPSSPRGRRAHRTPRPASPGVAAVERGRERAQQLADEFATLLPGGAAGRAISARGALQTTASAASGPVCRKCAAPRVEPAAPQTPVPPHPRRRTTSADLVAKAAAVAKAGANAPAFTAAAAHTAPEDVGTYPAAFLNMFCASAARSVDSEKASVWLFGQDTPSGSGSGSGKHKKFFRKVMEYPRGVPGGTAKSTGTACGLLSSSSGLVATVFESRVAINLADAPLSALRTPETVRELGEFRNALVVPLFRKGAHQGQCIGVTVYVNKQSGSPRFSLYDETASAGAAELLASAMAAYPPTFFYLDAASLYDPSLKPLDQAVLPPQPPVGAEDGDVESLALTPRTRLLGKQVLDTRPPMLMYRTGEHPAHITGKELMTAKSVALDGSNLSDLSRLLQYTEQMWRGALDDNSILQAECRWWQGRTAEAQAKVRWLQRQSEKAQRSTNLQYVHFLLAQLPPETAPSGAKPDVSNVRPYSHEPILHEHTEYQLHAGETRNVAVQTERMRVEPWGSPPGTAKAKSGAQLLKAATGRLIFGIRGAKGRGAQDAAAAVSPAASHSARSPASATPARAPTGIRIHPPHPPPTILQLGPSQDAGCP